MSQAKWNLGSTVEELGTRSWPTIEKAIFNAEGENVFLTMDGETLSAPLTALIDGRPAKQAVTELYKLEVIQPAKAEALAQATIVGRIFREDRTYEADARDMSVKSGDHESIIYYSTLQQKTDELATRFSARMADAFRSVAEIAVARDEAPARAFG